MDITSAQFLNNPITNEANSLIIAIIDGTEMFVPLDPDNTHYAEIMRQVEAGTLTIQDAD
jgi:hypothetical protein